MIEVNVHAIDINNADTFSVTSTDFLVSSGTVLVTATVRVWHGLQLMWELDRQEFTFYKCPIGNTEHFEKLITDIIIGRVKYD